MNFISAHAHEILAAIVGAIVGAGISIPITVRVTRNTLSGSSSNVNQGRSQAGGDIVGRDKIGL